LFGNHRFFGRPKSQGTLFFEMIVYVIGFVICVYHGITFRQNFKVSMEFALIFVICFCVMLRTYLKNNKLKQELSERYDRLNEVCREDSLNDYESFEDEIDDDDEGEL